MLYLIWQHSSLTSLILWLMTKKNNMCLVQHRRYEKSHSAVPKTERLAMIRRLLPSRHILLLIRLVNLFTFVLKFCGTLQKGPKNFPRNLSNTQWILGWLSAIRWISKVRNLNQLWHFQILLENEMLKNIKAFKIGPRLDVSVYVQSFSTQHTFVK